MKNINKETLERDKNTLVEMLTRYNDAIWEPREAQSAHFDNQPKIVQLIMRDVQVGLSVALEAVKQLSGWEVIED